MGSKRYEFLSSERQAFLNRAREAAKLTLPMLISPNENVGNTGGNNYKTPWQSVGARGVASLSSNILLSLFPSGFPFFRLLVSESDFEDFGEQAEQIMKEVNETLADIEKRTLEEVEGKNLRSTIFEAIKNLLVAGSSLVYVQPNGELRNYTIESFVCNRDVEGNVMEIVIKETISIKVAEEMGLLNGSDGDDKEVDLYTCVERRDGKFYAWQEIDGVVIEDTEEEFELDKLPWIPIRLTKVTGESYGRSYIENVAGDLKSLEGLSKAINEAAGISAKTIFFVKPGSLTNVRDVEEAENGEVISGLAGDVSAFRVDKGSDLSIAFQAAQTIEQRLSFSFNLLDSTLPTQGQTTAFEVQQIVNSLEKVLSGVYAMLSNEFMQPLVRRIIDRLAEEEKIPELPEQVKLIISTGLTALGRASDIQRLMSFSQVATQVAPQAFGALVDQEKVLRQLESASGVDVLKSAEQLQEEQERILREQELLKEQEGVDNPAIIEQLNNG